MGLGLQPPVPPLDAPPLDVVPPPPEQRQVWPFQEPPLLRQVLRWALSQLVAPPVLLLLDPVAPPVEDVLDVVPAAQVQVPLFHAPPPFMHAVRSASLQMEEPWQRPFCVQVPPAWQSVADRHSTQRPTPLAGAEHSGVGDEHWLASLQKPGASGPHELVVVLQNWSWEHWLLEVQDVPPVPRATQRWVAPSQKSVSAHWSSETQLVPAVPPLAPPVVPPRAGTHSPSRHTLPSSQSASAVHPVEEVLLHASVPMPSTPANPRVAQHHVSTLRTM